MTKKKSITFLANHAAFFVSHRLQLAIEARKQGYDVSLIFGIPSSAEMNSLAERKLCESGFKYKIISFNGARKNPITEFVGLVHLFIYVFIHKTEILHCISPIGVLYGGIISSVIKSQNLVMSISGLGYLFTDESDKSLKKLTLRNIYMLLLRYIFLKKNKKIIIQNNDDMEFVMSLGCDESSIVMIRGMGVDLSHYNHLDINSKQKIVLFPARLLRDKGIYEFIEAATVIKKRHGDWQFIVAGAGDYDNPTKVHKSEIMEWVNCRIVNWVGHIDDISELFKKSSIVCLPSYREGFPKCLMEAAAGACAVVTSDTVGCRDAIINNKTGVLVPIKDVPALIEALDYLICNHEIRETFGIQGRTMALDLYNQNAITELHMKIYDGMKLL